jgi:hypothetical protein
LASILGNEVYATSMINKVDVVSRLLRGETFGIG